MKTVIQKVSSAAVYVDDIMISEIGTGLLILLGIEKNDTQSDLIWLVEKIIKMRIFLDNEQKMNHSLLDIEGEALVVSQFTLCADTKKGNRPSFVQAAVPEVAQLLYSQFVHKMSESLKKEVKTGEFGANMQIKLVNEGPVTIVMDTKNK